MNESRASKMQSHSMDTVLAPLGLEEFFESYWERQTLHIERDAGEHFEKLLTLTHLEDLFGTQALHFPQVQLTQAGQSILVTDYTDANRRILPNRLAEYHHSGSTVVISQAHTLLPVLAEFCRNVNSSMHMNCQANVYFSPPGQQGFNTHYDTHDVFILQVAGRKTFRLYGQGATLPMTDEQFDPETLPESDIEETVELSAGHTLYIPRGVTHDALASNDEPSLHITLGVYAVTVFDVLQSSLELAAGRDVALRESISRSLWARSDINIQNCSDDKARGTAILALLNRVTTEDVNTAVTLLKDAYAIEQKQQCSALFSRAEHIDKLSVKSKLLINKRHVLGMEWGPQGGLIRTFGQTLELESHMHAAVVQMIELGEFNLSDIDTLADDQKLALAGELLRAGIVGTII